MRFLLKSCEATLPDVSGWNPVPFRKRCVAKARDNDLLRFTLTRRRLRVPRVRLHFCPGSAVINLYGSIAVPPSRNIDSLPRFCCNEPHSRTCSRCITDAMPIFPRPAGNGVGVFQSAAPGSTSNPQGKRFPHRDCCFSCFFRSTGEHYANMLYLSH